MKLINRDYGYLFDCSIKGKIQMTKSELDQFVKEFKRSKKWRVYMQDHEKRMFESDLNRKITAGKTKYWINVRVFATEVLAYKYELKGYKRQNYMLEIEDPAHGAPITIDKALLKKLHYEDYREFAEALGNWAYNTDFTYRSHLYTRSFDTLVREFVREMLED